MIKLIHFWAIFALCGVGYSTAQTNQHFWHTLPSQATADAIWDIWADVPNWNRWDIGLKSSNGQDLKLNSTGYIVDLKGRKSKFKIIQYAENESYTLKINLFLSSLNITRSLKVENGQCQFTHEVRFKGLLKSVFGAILGKKFKTLLPKAMENINLLAENKN